MELNTLLIIYATIFAAVIGSFLACMIYRIPRKENIYNNSHCPHCGTEIPLYFNIPILSWLMLGGYTKCCQQKISFQYLLIEASAAAAGFLIAYFVSPWLVLGIGFTCIIGSIIISAITRRN